MIFPWPPKALSPNARNHWAVKSAAAKKYRSDCYYIAHAAKPAIPDGKMIMQITFRPPDRRRRDDDNLIAAFKAGRDGIADALGVDDSRFSILVEIGTPVPGHGMVQVSFLRADAVK